MPYSQLKYIHQPIFKTCLFPRYSAYEYGHWKKELIEVEIMFLVGRLGDM